MATNKKPSRKRTERHRPKAPKPASISGIPPADVGRVVQDFVDDGHKRILAEEQSTHTFSVTPLE